MKILVISHYYAPEIGAPQRRLTSLIQRWQDAGHQVTVICPGPHYPDARSTEELRKGAARAFRTEQGEFGEVILRMPYILHGFSGWSRAADQILVAVSSMLAAAEQRLRGRTFDVAIATVPGVPTLFAGLGIKKILNVPLIIEMRDAWPDVISSTKRNNPLMELASKKVFAPRLTAAQRKADALVTTTENFAQVLRARGMNRVHTISNGTSEQKAISAIAPLEKQSLQLKLLYAGTVGRSQGLENLIKGFAMACTQNPNVNFSLRIVGEGASKTGLEELAAELRAPVEFLPLQSREAITEHYAWADATVVSLKDLPAFEWTVPSKLFELLTVPRFVIGMVRGEAADILKASGAGVCLDPSDVVGLANLLGELAVDSSKLLVGNQGKKFVMQRFHDDILAREYIELMTQLSKGRE